MNGKRGPIGWISGRWLDSQWPTLGLNVSAIPRNLYLEVRVWRRTYQAQIWWRQG